MAQAVGDEILATTSAGTTVQGCATRDSKTGELIVKLVNPQTTAETLKMEINGAPSLAAKGIVIALMGNPDDSNSITEPKRVVPTTKTLRGIKSGFTYKMPPHSVVVLKLKAKP